MVRKEFGSFTMRVPRLGDRGGKAPLTARRDHAMPSLFCPENLLATARRQKALGTGRVPRICLLDPDNPGDVTNLTFNGATSYDEEPVWSPDGKKRSEERRVGKECRSRW